MIDHVWTVLCSRVVIDKNSNNVSIQNVIEQITIQGEPQPEQVIDIAYEVVSLWTRSDPDVPSRGQARLTFFIPSGRQAGSVEVELDLSEYERLRTRRVFQGLPAVEPGRHTWLVELRDEGEDDWQKVASIPIKVVFVPVESEEETAEEAE
jgi:hypothetical protein